MRLARLWATLVFCAVLAESAAAEKMLSSGWFYSGDSFKVGEAIVYVEHFAYWKPPEMDNRSRYTADAEDMEDEEFDKEANWRFQDIERNRLYLTRNNRGIVLKLTGCFDENLVEYCFKEISWWDKDHGGTAKYEGGELKPALQIEVKQLEAIIQVTELVEPTLVDKFEEARVTVKLENTGTEPANTVEYRESWSGPVVIRTPSGLSLEEGELRWTGTLRSNDIRTFSYYISPQTDERAESKSNLSYQYRGRTVNQTSSASLSVRSPVTVAAGIQPASTGVEETTKYSFSATNNDLSEKMQMDVLVSFPRELDLLSNFEGTEEDPGLLRVTKTLGAEDSYAFSMLLRGHFTGEYLIRTTALFDVRNEEIERAFNSTYLIEQGRLTPVIRFDADSVEGGSPVIVRALLINIEADQHLVDIVGTLESPLFERPFTFELEQLVAGTAEVVFDAPVATPISSADVQDTFNLTGTYRLASGEQFSFSTAKSLAIKPVTGERFAIEQDADKAAAAAGENVTIYVRVENLKAVRAAKVAVGEILPPWLEVVGGTGRAELDLDPRQKRQAYLYRLRVLPNASVGLSNITTRVTYQAFTAEKSWMLNITEPAAAPVEAPNESNQTAETPGVVEQPTPPPLDERKPGFFSRIWSGIKGFFKGLFGKKDAQPPSAPPSLEQPSNTTDNATMDAETASNMATA